MRAKPTPDLHAHIVVDHRGVDATIAVAPGQRLALLGANGSGKTTILEAIAGLVPIDAGAVTVSGRDVTRTRIRDRGTGLLGQDQALFPALTVLDNVAYGPRSRGLRRDQARRVALTWLDRVGLSAMATRRIGELSGGEARRVALARALAGDPAVLLLDEPFAGLDVDAAGAVREALRGLLDGVTTVLSTHDTLDAHALATDVAVVSRGRIAESGTVAQVLTHPRTRFAAQMAGRVLLTGTMSGGALVLANGTRLPVTGGPGAAGAAAVALRHTHVQMSAGDGASERPGMVHVADAVVQIEPRGDTVRVTGALAAAEADAAEAARLVTGSPVGFWIPAGLKAYSLGD